MKKTVFTLIFAFMAMTSAFADGTPVTITVDNLTSTTITCSFTIGSYQSYYIVAAETGSVEPWVGTFMGGATLEETIVQWGIQYTADAQYTWTSMTPGTEYVIYAVGKYDQDLTLYTDTVVTPAGGGAGTSVVTVSVSNPTLNGITTKAVPNSETMLFKDILFERGVLDTVAFDTVVVWMQNDYNSYYETDEWAWTTLDSCTDYIFMAQGMNADSVWGPIDSIGFRTLGVTTAVEDIESNGISVYPNPAVEFVTVSGVALGSTIVVIDAQGRTVSEVEALSDQVRLNVKNYIDGVYFVVVRGNANSIRKFIKQ